MIDTTYKVGDRVKAFHPRKFGVIDHGTIVAIGHKWIHVDFGVLHGGTFRVAPIYVVEAIEGR
jgi:hypothetical protein